MSGTPETDALCDKQKPIINKYQWRKAAIELAGHARTLERRAIAAGAACAEMRGALLDYTSRCRDCGGVGWYMRQASNGEPEQEQCQWCDHGLIALSTTAGANLLESKRKLEDDLAQIQESVRPLIDCATERGWLGKVPGGPTFSEFLLAELTALRAANTQLEKDLAHSKKTARDRFDDMMLVCEQRDKAQDENTALRAKVGGARSAIEKAPHASGCIAEEPK